MTRLVRQANDGRYGLETEAAILERAARIRRLRSRALSASLVAVAVVLLGSGLAIGRLSTEAAETSPAGVVATTPSPPVHPDDQIIIDGEAVGVELRKAARCVEGNQVVEVWLRNAGSAAFRLDALRVEKPFVGDFLAGAPVELAPGEEAGASIEVDGSISGDIWIVWTIAENPGGSGGASGHSLEGCP